jgi:hypothetical protein
VTVDHRQAGAHVAGEIEGGDAGSLSGAAHSLQNFALSGFSVPQEGQTATGGV